MHFRLIILTILSALLLPDLLSPLSSGAYAQSGQGINRKDARGRKQGYWKKIEEGIVKYEGNFVDDKPVGEFKYYYPGGTLKAKTFFTGINDLSRTVTFHRNGKMMARGNYLGNLKDSTWVYYNEEEQIVSSIAMKDGKRHGLSRTFYPGGKIDEDMNYSADVRHGEWTQYFPDGTLKLKAKYVSGKLQGLMQTFHTNGKVMVSGTYKDSLKEGTWMYFDENGFVQKKETWANGFRITEVYLDKKLLEEVKRRDSIKE